MRILKKIIGISLLALPVTTMLYVAVIGMGISRFLLLMSVILTFAALTALGMKLLLD